MKIQYCSDLHLEFLENRKFLRDHPIIPRGEILILAGDIVPFQQLEKRMDFFQFASEHFKATYWLPGNHEYYHSELSNREGSFSEQIKPNVFLVNDTSVIIDNARLIFSTLWSNINPANDWYIERGMSDFEVIKYHGERLTVRDVNELHYQSLEFIKAELQKNFKGKTIVATHHVPTFQQYPEQYRTSSLNEAFATELSPMIEGSDIDYWIYGHHHTNTREFKIGNTKMVTNQLGYVQYEEHDLFDCERCMEL